jgi:predicted nucleic acid-binding Zn finger protein
MARSDTRIDKAVELAGEAGQWARVRSQDGRKFYGVRSQHNRHRMYLVNRTVCDCEDFRRSSGQFLCKHIMAVRLHCERLASGPAAMAIAGEAAA